MDVQQMFRLFIATVTVTAPNDLDEDTAWEMQQKVRSLALRKADEFREELAGLDPTLVLETSE
jgi:hypothetical protein